MGFSKYPLSLDDSVSLPESVDLVTPIKAEVVNRLRDAIIATQTELGTNPSGTFGTVKAKLDDLSASIESLGGSTASESDFVALTAQVNSIQTNLNSHISNLSNPHSVTTTQIGAATATDLTNHISDTGNPHSVTASQVGAPALVNPSTDTALVRFNGISGVQQNSVVLLDGTGNMTFPNSSIIQALDTGATTRDLLQINGADLAILGDAAISGETTSLSSWSFRVGGTIRAQFNAGGLTINQNDIVFADAATAPHLYQTTKLASGTGDTFTINSQDSAIAGATNIGGSLIIRAGDATNATSNTGGSVNIRAGVGSTTNGTLNLQDSGGTPRLTVTAAGNLTLSGSSQVDISGSTSSVRIGFNSEILIITGSNIAFHQTAVSNPVILQKDDSTASATGDTFTIHAQNTTGASSTGGSLTLNAGSGLSADGNVNIGDANTALINIGNVTDNPAIVFVGSGDIRLDSQIRFTERTGDPANVANTGFVYTKDISSVTQLFYEDSAGGVTQLTTAGGGTVVTGSGSDNNIVRWDGTNALQNSGLAIDDSDNLSGATSISIGATPAASGALRLTNAEIIKSITTGATDTDLIQLTGSNAIIVGDAAVSSELTSASTINIRIASVLRAQFNAAGLSILQNDIQFSDTSATAPHIYQGNKSATGAGDTFTINAQNSTAASGSNTGGALTIYAGDSSGAGTDGTGGLLTLRGGDATNATTSTGGAITIRSGDGTSADGVVNITKGTSISGFTIDGSNNVYVGGTISAGTRPPSVIIDPQSSGFLRTAGGDRFSWGVSSVQVTPAIFQFASSTASPVFLQADDNTASGASGDTMTIHAQDTPGASGANTAGDLIIRAGDSLGAGLSDVGGDLTIRPGNADTEGTLTIQAGSGNAGFTASGTNSFTMGNSTAVCNYSSGSTGHTFSRSGSTRLIITSIINNYTTEYRFHQDVVSPSIRQHDDTNNSITGDTLLIHAQDCTGTATTGGDLHLRPGTGTNTSGELELQDAGGTPRITVNDTLITLGHSSMFFDDVLQASCIISILPESSRDGYDIFVQGQETSLASGTAGAAQILGGVASGSSGQGGDVLVVGGAGTGTNASGGNVYISSGSKNGTGTVGNIAFHDTATTNFGSGEEVMFIGNATTVPSGDPSSGGLLYAEGGAGKWRSSSGTTTTFAPADPHCPTCGRDSALEWKNDTEGWELSICMWCVTDAINNIGIIKKEQK